MRILKNIGLISVIAALSFNVFAGGGGGGGSNPTTKMIVGDSIFALSGDIHDYLESDLNETIRTYARSGCQMIGGNLICSSYYSIPRQYSRASKRGINTVIFNGGGNDFLLGDGADCSTQSCINELLISLEQTISTLVNNMKRDGMQKILYLGYYYIGDTANDAISKASMDYKAANYPAMGVTFVDSRASFQGNERRYITSDGIHPTAAGSRVLATLIRNAL